MSLVINDVTVNFASKILLIQSRRELFFRKPCFYKSI